VPGKKHDRTGTEAYFTALDAESKSTALALRALVRVTAPRLKETLKMGVPMWVGNDVVLYIAEYRHHFNLGFRYGARLKDTTGLLEGTGKGMRHVKVAKGAPFPRAKIATLIRQAVLLDGA
jgi:hypothetical protein